MNRDPLEVGIFPCRGYLVLGFSWFPDVFLHIRKTRRTHLFFSSCQFGCVTIASAFYRYVMRPSALGCPSKRDLHHLFMSPTNPPRSSALLAFCFVSLFWKCPYQNISNILPSHFNYICIVLSQLDIFVNLKWAWWLSWIIFLVYKWNNKKMIFSSPKKSITIILSRDLA